MTARQLKKAIVSIDTQLIELENSSSDYVLFQQRLTALQADVKRLKEENPIINLDAQEGRLASLRQEVNPQRLSPQIMEWTERRSAEIERAYTEYDQYRSRGNTPELIPESPLTQKQKQELYKERRAAHHRLMSNVFQEMHQRRLMSNVFQEIRQRRLEKLGGLEIDHEIDSFFWVLGDLQWAVPELSDAFETMLTLMENFKRSKRDAEALNEFISASGEHITQVNESVRDPIQARFWHSVVLTFKCFLHWLDLLQSQLTGATIDKEGRPHFFAEPALPVRDAKAEYVKACQQMLTKLDELDQQNLLPQANRD